jgi:DNA-binding MarR family transcriptional regulator
MMTVIILLMANAFSENSIKSCTCAPGSCQSSKMKDCCGKSSDDYGYLKVCSCTSHLPLFSGIDAFDPENSSFSINRPQTLCRYETPKSVLESANKFVYYNPTSLNPDNLGPPDLDVLEYLPPSAKQIFNVLATSGPLTQKDLISKTDLPPRTVRYALYRLKGEDMLEERFCFQDARQSLYSLATACSK